MDTDSRVESLIDDGKRVVDYLPPNGFPVAAAFWLRASEDGRWYFYLVSPVVDAEGLPKAYRQLHTLVRQMPGPVRIDPLEAKLIGPDNPLAEDVLAIHVHATGPDVSAIRWRGRRLGNISIEDAYVYAPPGAVA